MQEEEGERKEERKIVNVLRALHIREKKNPRSTSEEKRVKQTNKIHRISCLADSPVNVHVGKKILVQHLNEKKKQGLSS